MDRLAQLLRMREENESDSFIQYALAKEYEKLGELEKALKEFLLLKKNDPNYVGMYYHIGGILEELGQPANALEIYEEGIQVAKKLPDYHALSELNNVKTNLEMEL